MIIVNTVGLILALVVSIVGIVAYLSEIREMTYDYEDHLSDICPPERTLQIGLAIGLFAYALISSLLLIFVGGKVLSVIFLIISLAIAALFAVLVVGNEGRSSMAVFGCLIPPLMTAMMATMELFRADNIAGFSLIIAFYALVALVLFTVAKVKVTHGKRPQRRCDYED